MSSFYNVSVIQFISRNIIYILKSSIYKNIEYKSFLNHFKSMFGCTHASMLMDINLFRNSDNIMVAAECYNNLIKKFNFYIHA